MVWWCWRGSLPVASEFWSQFPSAWGRGCMLMKPSSPGRELVSRAKARNAAMLNLLATPGLGSLLCRRWIAGAGQLILCIAGFAVFMIWFVKEMIQYYGLITNDVPAQPQAQPIWWIAAT